MRLLLRMESMIQQILQTGEMPAPCDADCHKKKKLDALKMFLTSKNKYRNPNSYEQARIAYNTELHGQEWLQKEKESIAKKEVEPMLADYKFKYDSLKQQKKTQSMFTTLISHNIQDSQFIDDKLRKQEGHVSTLVRLNELADSPEHFSLLTIILDTIIVLLGVVFMYLLFRKFGHYIGFSSNVSVPETTV